VLAGITLVPPWWGVGAAAGLGAWCIVNSALEQAGTTALVMALGKAPPDMMAVAVADAFADGALSGAVGAILSGGACFSGEMLLDVEGGKKRAEAIRVGDRLASRPELEPEGPLAYKEVKAVFERWAPLWEVEVGGQVLRTTGEHPFWVEGRRGWVSARELLVGDLLRTKDGRLVAVARVEATGSWEKVYNWEIEDYHTYYVSAGLDAGSIWAHNNNCNPTRVNPKTGNVQSLRRSRGGSGPRRWQNVEEPRRRSAAQPMERDPQSARAGAGTRPPARSLEIQPGKGARAGGALSLDEAIAIVRAGGDVIAKDQSTARMIASQAGVGPPIFNGPHGPRQRLHFHPNPRTGGHVLF
jgi:hypothetical protein